MYPAFLQGGEEEKEEGEERKEREKGEKGVNLSPYPDI